MIFDVIPVPQGRYSNCISIGIQSLCATACLVLFLSFDYADVYPSLNHVVQFFIEHKIPFAVRYVFLGITGFCLLTIYEAWLELYRINKIVKSIKGKRDSHKQYAEGKYNDSNIQFFIGNPTSINYSISLDGAQALARSEELREFINQAMKERALKGYKLLIDKEAVIFSKFFIIAFQLRVNEAKDIYKILDSARILLLNKTASGTNNDNKA